MSPGTTLRDNALLFHQHLPQRLWRHLNSRGIPDDLIHKYLLGWNGERITIPIPNREGQFAFFKLAKDPEDRSDGPKMFSTPGAHAELYGWERLLAKPEEIVICEGEFDRLVLESRGFPAVTSTGGSLTFRPGWAEAFSEIPRVYICFDNDEAGRTGSDRVARMIPHARIIRLPDDVGDAGDATDFFVRLGRTREEFIRLWGHAQPVPDKKGSTVTASAATPARPGRDQDLAGVTMEKLIGQYVHLRRSGERFIGRCPFHDDRIPSLVVYPATRSFYCFGCRASGDALSFLMKAENLTFPEALTVLRRLA